MALNTITLKWDLSNLIQSGLQAVLSVTPTAQMADTADHLLIPPVPQTVTFNGTGQLPGIVANDNVNISPAGTGYLISVTTVSGQVIIPQFQTQLLFSNGAVQWLDQLVIVPVVTTGFQFMPLPSGSPSAGQVPAATGSGESSAWAWTPGTVLASSVYAPGTQTALTVSSATMAAFSAGNVNTGSFTAPASGNVLVTAVFAGAGSAASTFSAFGLADHGTTNMRGSQYQTEVSSAGQVPSFALHLVITGLTPGTSYDFDLMGAASGGTFTIFAFSQTTTTPTLGASGRGGPVLMTVQAM